MVYYSDSTIGATSIMASTDDYGSDSADITVTTGESGLTAAPTFTITDSDGMMKTAAKDLRYNHHYRDGKSR